MPETDALIPAEGGKRVTITIAELTDSESAAAESTPTDSSGDLSSFEIVSGKHRLTITIAE